MENSASALRQLSSAALEAIRWSKLPLEVSLDLEQGRDTNPESAEATLEWLESLDRKLDSLVMEVLEAGPTGTL